MSNYPAGAKFDPRAPYNEDTIPTEVDICVSYSISLSTTVEVSLTKEERRDNDYSNVDLMEAYTKVGPTLPEILEFAAIMAESREDEVISPSAKRYYREIKEAARSWYIDDSAAVAE